MIRFERTVLDNGLRVLVHHDPGSPLVALNILYDAGSKDEDPDRTGFAHLFEHLMFGGSVNIPSYDTPLQEAGGENNAFTNTDITNYYLSLPAANLETGLWLESDRMLGLDFSEKSLEVQRNVVVEEFKQRYLNQPYGDAYLLLRPLAYRVHPYHWSTIGKEIGHITGARLSDVEQFFYSHYAPNNAILVLAGNIDPKKGLERVKHWFDPIEARQIKARDLPPEPEQAEARFMSVNRDVPFDAIYRAWHMPGRRDERYHACDLLSDILSNGRSSRLYRSLVMEKKIFSDINAYITAEMDPGLMVITGKLIRGISPEKGNQAIEEELERISAIRPGRKELDKVKNKVEASLLFSETDVLERAMNLAMYEWLGDAGMINHEVGKYMKVSPDDIQETAAQIFREQNGSTLFYLNREAKK